MNIWKILGIEPTQDVKVIRKRYAEMVRLYHPEDQPELYQEIVQAYQEALAYARSSKIGQETDTRTGFEQHQWQRQEKSNEIRVNSPNFDTFEYEKGPEQEQEESSSLDFSDYRDTAYLIRTSIDSILGNADYSFEEQANLWQQFFYHYRYSMNIVKAVLEEMDVYIFNRYEHFAILLPLLEEYMIDYRDWGYYYKLKYWQNRRAIAKENGSPMETAKKETEQFYDSYLWCQDILNDYQKANQIRTWIEYFKQPYVSSMVLFQVNRKCQIIESIPVLSYILEKIKQNLDEVDEDSYEQLVAYIEAIKEESNEKVDLQQFSLEDSEEVEIAFCHLLYANYPDEYGLLRDWQFLFEQVEDKSILLALLDEVDVYPLTNIKVLTLILSFVENYSKDKESPYLKKLQFWKIVQSYPALVEEFELNKKENFEYWYHEGYLLVERITSSDDLINDWDKWKEYLKAKPRIITVFLEQLYREYHRFKDGQLLRYVLGVFPTSKISPQIMKEETDQKLEEMTAYAYELCYPKSIVPFMIWKKGLSAINKHLLAIFGLLTIFSLIQSFNEKAGSNTWVYIGMLSLFYFFLLKKHQRFIEAGLIARWIKPKWYYNLTLWVLGILSLIFFFPTLPLGLIAALSFITLFTFIDNLKVDSKIIWDYPIDKIHSVGFLLTTGFIISLILHNEFVIAVLFRYFFLFMLVFFLFLYKFIDFSVPASAKEVGIKEVGIPCFLSLQLFRLVPYFEDRVNLFSPLIMSKETFSLTLLLFINAIALSYFTKERRSTLAVKKIFMIYSLQLFIFLRRLYRIFFGPVLDLLSKQIEPDILLQNSEFAFFFQEVVFIFLLILLVRNIRKENGEGTDWN
mgnify:FL=1